MLSQENTLIISYSNVDCVLEKAIKLAKVLKHKIRRLQYFLNTSLIIIITFGSKTNKSYYFSDFFYTYMYI